jgi:hypothetical protein
MTQGTTMLGLLCRGGVVSVWSGLNPRRHLCDHGPRMAETPETDLADPDLVASGEPIRATLALEDGTQLPYEIPQTKRDNCIALAARASGEEFVTRSMVEAHPYVTWRDFNDWIIELLEYQKGRDYYWDNASGVLRQVRPARDISGPARPPASDEGRELERRS